MTTSSLRTVTLETVANYRQVAEHAVGAYRASGHRLLDLLSRNLDRSTSRIAPRLAAVLQHTSTTVSDAAAKGLDSVSSQAERVVEMGSNRVSAQITRVADLVEGIENRYVATGLQQAARLSLTGAQAALTLSGKLAAGADKLAAVVGGKPVHRGGKAAARATTAVKAARRATAPAQPKAAKATVKKVTKATRVAVKGVKSAGKPATQRLLKARTTRRSTGKAQSATA